MNQNLRATAKAIRTAATAFAVIAIFCGQARAVNDLLTQWTFETSIPATAGPHAAEVGTGSATGLHAGATVYSNPAGNGSNESFSSTAWAVGDYYQYQTSTTGLSDIGVQFDQVSSTTGPRDFKLQYSTNGTNFTDFASYMLAPNNAPAWASAGAVQPIGMDTFNFDLRSISALNNAANIYFRMTDNSTVSANGIGTVPATGTDRMDNVTIFNNFDPTQAPIVQPPPAPVLPQAGDVAFGSNADRAKTTLPLLRGPASGVGAPPTPYSLWQSTPFIQSVEFDNTGGTMHNVKGNLLGLNFGRATSNNSGEIYSFATQGSLPAPAGQKIGDTLGLGEGTGIATARLAGLSVSPNNSKIAVTGFETGKVAVYDYTAGDTLGSGASLSGGRESAVTLTPSITQGTTWVSDSKVLTLANTGSLFEVDASSMAVTAVGPSLTPPAVGASSFTSLYYNPAVSQYVWAMSSAFNITAETDVYVLDPASNYAIVDQAVYTTSTDSAREIALDAAGNLFMGVNGSKISVVVNAAANVGSLADDNAALWYTEPLFLTAPNFSGLDVGLAAAGLAGDYNGDGKVNGADYVRWRNDPASFGGDPGGYNTWRANYGASLGSGGGLGGATAVPEPASAALLMIGLVALCLRRRAA